MPQLSAPTNLVATAISSAEIGLSWVDNSNQEKGFLIERLYNGIWTQIVKVPKDTRSYRDTNILPNTNYSYRVRASAI